MGVVINNKRFLWVTAGILFAILWSSASTATKFGLTVAQPLVIAEVRFALASALMLFVAHGVLKQRLPAGKEWRYVAFYGLLNISIYLGLYVVAMQHITAGIGALAVASNPVFISFFSVIILKSRPGAPVISSIVVCMLGVLCASWPLIGNASVNVNGLVVLFLSMLSYSLGAIYFSSRNWGGLSLLTINGWQTLLGGLFLCPVTVFFFRPGSNYFNSRFWLSVGWLAIPVSIFAVQLWLWLLEVNAIRAGLWLFLCPLFGFIIAAWLLNDQISSYTVTGVILVVAGLLLSKLNTKKNEVVFD